MSSSIRIPLAVLFQFALACLAVAKPHPIQVKVVVVAMFEVGADAGDQPGELQY